MWVDFHHWSEQKLQTGLLKMPIHSLPVGDAFGTQKYSGFPSNGFKQSSAQLINDTLSGKMKNAIETFLKTIGSLQRFIHIKLELVQMRKVWKKIAYIDEESPLMSYQRMLTFDFLLVILT